MEKQEALELRLTLSAHKNKAFSLLEVSLVIFLLALIFSLSIPIFSVANNNRLKDLSAKFVNLVNYTRDQASIHNVPHFLYLDSQKNEIFVYREEFELDTFFVEDKNEQEPFQSDRILINKINPNLSIGSITYNNKEIISVSLRFDPSGFSEIFKIAFTDKKNTIYYNQTSVLGAFDVRTTK